MADWFYSLERWQQALVLALLAILTLVAVVLFWYFFAESGEISAQVYGFSWEYEIGIEDEVRKDDDGWCDEAPIGATIDSRTAVPVSTASATTKEETRQYCTWHTFEVEEVRDVESSGTGRTSMYWPDVKLTGDEEICCYRERYYTDFQQDGGAILTYSNLSFDDWFRYELGEFYTLGVNRAGGITSVKDRHQAK